MTAAPSATPSPLGEPPPASPQAAAARSPYPTTRPHNDPATYRRRHRIENLFARLKDWRRIATRYDRCAHIFMAAITIIDADRKSVHCRSAAFAFWVI